MDDSTGGGGGVAGSPARPTIVDTWLQPLADSACGENLEYDDEFREMEKAAVGRPPSQFEAEGVAPDWRAVLGHSQSLFDRTRDLRVAIYWSRARIHLEGAATLPEGLRLIEGLLARFWDDLHPLPDDGDAYARVNALNDMCSLAGMLGDLRESLILDDRSVGELRGRDVEIALGARARRPDIPLVVRMDNDAFADAVSEIFGIAAFSPSALTAPALAGLSRFPGTRGRVRYAGEDHTISQRSQTAQPEKPPADVCIPLCVWRNGQQIPIREFGQMKPYDELLFAVPLAQLKPGADADDATRQAVEDWLYWVEQGYEF